MSFFLCCNAIKEGISILMPMVCPKFIIKSKVRRATKNSTIFSQFFACAFCHWWNDVTEFLAILCRRIPCIAFPEPWGDAVWRCPEWQRPTARNCCHLGRVLPPECASALASWIRMVSPHPPIFTYALLFLSSGWLSASSMQQSVSTPQWVSGRAQRKEKSKGQAARCVDTKSQRISVHWHGTLFLWVNPQVLSKTASLVSATHRRLQKSHSNPNSFRLPYISPGCSTSGGSMEETAGDSTADLRRNHPVQLIPEWLGHCQSTCWQGPISDAYQRHHCTSFTTGSSTAWYPSGQLQHGDRRAITITFHGRKKTPNI